jgi:hypothetical protein
MLLAVQSGRCVSTPAPRLEAGTDSIVLRRLWLGTLPPHPLRPYPKAFTSSLERVCVCAWVGWRVELPINVAKSQNLSPPAQSLIGD